MLPPWPWATTGLAVVSRPRRLAAMAHCSCHCSSSSWLHNRVTRIEDSLTWSRGTGRGESPGPWAAASWPVPAALRRRGQGSGRTCPWRKEDVKLTVIAWYSRVLAVAVVAVDDVAGVAAGRVGRPRHVGEAASVIYITTVVPRITWQGTAACCWGSPTC